MLSDVVPKNKAFFVSLLSFLNFPFAVLNQKTKMKGTKKTPNKKPGPRFPEFCGFQLFFLLFAVSLVFRVITSMLFMFDCMCMIEFPFEFPKY